MGSKTIEIKKRGLEIHFDLGDYSTYVISTKAELTVLTRLYIDWVKGQTWVVTSGRHVGIDWCWIK